MKKEPKLSQAQINCGWAAGEQWLLAMHPALKATPPPAAARKEGWPGLWCIATLALCYCRLLAVMAIPQLPGHSWLTKDTGSGVERWGATLTMISGAD